jgi:hypothetical protein
LTVKGGDNVSVAQVRDLLGTTQREQAVGGLFLTLAEPTREMRLRPGSSIPASARIRASRS